MNERLMCVAPAEFTKIDPCQGEVKQRVLTDETTVVVCDLHQKLYPIKDSGSTPSTSPAENQNPS